MFITGCIDGTHVTIPQPGDPNTEFSRRFINRKGFASINVQAVCDDKLFFTDCCVGWPGGTHDARVFRNSALGSKSPTERAALFENDSHLLGDAAYALTETMLVPYKHSRLLTAGELRYNDAHSATRQTIERAFGLLKGRWRRLKYLEMRDLQFIPKMILGAFVMHNLALDVDCTDLLDFDSNDEQDTDNLGLVQQPTDPTGSARSENVKGKEKREQLVLFFS